MPAFVNFTCQRCGAELASLAQVDAHRCTPNSVLCHAATPIPEPRTRSKRDRINRLRERVAQTRSSHTTGLANVLLGILDLMEDEL